MLLLPDSPIGFCRYIWKGVQFFRLSSKISVSTRISTMYFLSH
ncbi:unnamed protein product [Bemisia tabaci]|uniref:Uncharacterized protein n=1 Tax=Bemisia tabaci TaxID=7038 RepID=A0A9N9ZW42_BEMTA|nr:unnamed protein product [Bemisia tabaci]